MLDVNTLPKSYRKVEEFEDDVGQMDVDRKRTEEGRQKIFLNKVCEKVARYVVQRQLTSYLHPNIASGPSDRSDQGKLRAQWKHHKIPEISICRRRRFSDI